MICITYNDVDINVNIKVIKMIEILDLIVLIIVFFLGNYATVIIHELGYIVFGNLSYEFVSYRVGSLMLLKKDGKFVWKKHTIPGTGG